MRSAGHIVCAWGASAEPIVSMLTSTHILTTINTRACKCLLVPLWCCANPIETMRIGEQLITKCCDIARNRVVDADHA